MNIDPEVLDMIAKYLGVNAVATLLLVILSYAGSAWMLNGLAAVDRWLDPSSKSASAGQSREKTPDAPPRP